MLNKYLPYFYLIIAFFFCSLPYLVHGYPQADDSALGLFRVKEFQLALAHNQLPPYWADNLYGGYGSPIFIFYAPLYMFVATIFYLLTGSIISRQHIGYIAIYRHRRCWNTPISKGNIR